MNKMRVKPRTYVRIRVGHQLKLGNSTRCYILQGPPEDEDDESEFTITELREQKAQREVELREQEEAIKLEHERLQKEKENAGISWGMSEDAEDEPDLSENPFAQTNNEELFLDDPKKTLRGYFEREGFELQYRCDELSPGVFICRVELPIDDEYGKNIICEVQHKGKKKECVIQCALEACRTLDRHGVLRQARHEPRRAQRTGGDDDDSDDDNFFDRTGDVEKKRLKKTQAAQSTAFTYDQLIEQEQEILDKIKTKEQKLELMVQIEKRKKMQNDEDLDQFMSNLSSMESNVDKFAISTTKTEIQNLKVDHQKLQKLINIAKPSTTLPPITGETKGRLPLFGKRNSLSRNFGVKRSEVLSVPVVKKVDEFEVEEEPEEEIVKQEMDKQRDLKEEDLPSTSTEKVLDELPPAATSECSGKKKADKPSDEPAEKKQKIEEVPNIQPVTETVDKKRKPRSRISRNRLRENIDMNDDDEYIDEEKVSTWVAPSNQTGDGTTHLNQKYGY